MSHIDAPLPDDDVFGEPPQKVNGKAKPEQPAAPAPKKKQRKNRGAYAASAGEAQLQEATKQATIPFRKPGRLNFFQACTEEGSRLREVYILDAGLDGFFLVNSDLVKQYPEVRRRVKRATLVTCVNHAGQYFVWPIFTDAIKSAVAALKAVAAAEGKWLRLTWNPFAQGYDHERPVPEEQPELVDKVPVFEPSGEDILDAAIEDAAIDDFSDPRLKQILRGLA